LKSNFSNSSEEEIEQFYKNISEKVRELRIKNNTTQLDLALEIGIKSVAFYSNCENNKYDKHFNLEHLYKISKFFGVDVTEII
jgi:DNA-binding XRE family transcriptional regulator